MVKEKKAKNPRGKPRRIFTVEQIKKMKKYALAGCQTGTIAMMLDIPVDTIKSREDIMLILRKKRAERKYKLRVAQNAAVSSGNPALLIFLGKNELEQKDSKDLNLGGTVNIILERE